MSMLNNVMGYWAYIRGGGLIFGEAYIRGEAYIWNEVSVKPGAHTAILVGRFKFRCMILANLAM